MNLPEILGSKANHGVTTEVICKCGFSCAPVNEVKDVSIMASGYTEGMVDVDWNSFGEYFDHLDKLSPGWMSPRSWATA